MHCSTTKLAGEQPLTNTTPGAFPETPAATADEEKQFSVNPIPASSGTGNPISLAPGHSIPPTSSFNSNTISSGVHDDPELKSAATGGQTFSVNPIPATGGASNPISLAPGEKVPHPSTLTGNTLGSNVKLDQASYEKADSGPPVLPPPLSPGSEREAAGAPIFGLGPAVGAGTIIPESGLPMGAAPATDATSTGPMMSSVAPTSTTAQLAGAVPLEPRGVPEVVEESQQAARAAPEASANPTAVVEKSAVEEELKAKVPEEPPTSESGVLGRSEGGVVGAAAGGLAAAGVAIGAAISSVAPNSTTNTLAGQVPKEERGVPEVVSESQQEAHVSPEAAANPEAVQEKSQVERELQAAVSKAPPTSESGMFGASERGVTGAIAGGVAAVGAGAAATAYALREQTTKATGTDPVSILPTAVQQRIDGNPAVTSATITDVAADTGVPQQYALGESVQTPGKSAARGTTNTVPSEVLTSQKEAHVGPEAAANAEAVREKQSVEQELLSKVKTENAQGTPAPTKTAALSETAPGTRSPSGAPQLNPIAGVTPIDLGNSSGLNAGATSTAVPPTQKENVTTSGDVSPMSKPNEPTVTTGVGSARVPTETTPGKRNSIADKLKSPTDSESSAKRKGFFGKIKDKLSNKSNK